MTQPPIPTRRTVGPKLKKELHDIALALSAVLADKADLAKREKELKSRIREIVTVYDLPFAKGASQFLNVPELDKSLRVTRPDPAPQIDPEAFRTAVGTDLFHELVTVLKVELKLPEWLQALEDERVTEASLLESLKGQEPGSDDPLTIAFSPSFDPKKSASQD